MDGERTMKSTNKEQLTVNRNKMDFVFQLIGVLFTAYC